MKNARNSLKTVLLSRNSFHFLVLSLGVSVLGLTACNYNISKVGSGSQIPNSVFSEKAVSYSRVYEVVIKPYCFKCHTDEGGNKGGVNLESYSNLMANIDDVGDDINDGSMPAHGSPQRARWDAQSEQLKTFFNRWLAAGAPEQEVSLPDDNQSSTTTTTIPELPTTTTTLPEMPTTTTTLSDSPVTTTTTTLPDLPTTTTTLPPPVEVTIHYTDVNRELVEAYCLRCHNNDVHKHGINLQGYENLKLNAVESQEQIEMGLMPPRGSQVPTDVLEKLTKWINEGMQE